MAKQQEEKAEKTETVKMKSRVNMTRGDEKIRIGDEYETTPDLAKADERLKRGSRI